MSREHHYLYAHRIIPKMFYEDPTKFIGLSNVEGKELAVGIWDMVADDIIGNRDNYLSPDGLDVIAVEEHPYIGSIYVMPEATEVAEAIMICALGKIHKPMFGKTKIKNPILYTLEFGLDENQEECTIFCSWNKEGSHLNFGKGPVATIKAFTEKCIMHSSGKVPALGRSHLGK